MSRGRATEREPGTSLVVYNSVIARLRRESGSMYAASAEPVPSVKP